MEHPKCTCGGQRVCTVCVLESFETDPFNRSVDLALSALHRAGLTVHRTPFEPLRLVSQ